MPPAPRRGRDVQRHRPFEDRILISSRGMVRALTKTAETDVAGSTNLDRFLSRLPKKYRGVATRPIRFIRTAGGIADGITPETVVVRRVCEALGISEEPQRRKLADMPEARTTIMVAHDASGRELADGAGHQEANP
jgi:hypothetical protein